MDAFIKLSQEAAIAGKRLKTILSGNNLALTLAEIGVVVDQATLAGISTLPAELTGVVTHVNALTSTVTQLVAAIQTSPIDKVNIALLLEDVFAHLNEINNYLKLINDSISGVIVSGGALPSANLIVLRVLSKVITDLLGIFHPKLLSLLELVGIVYPQLENDGLSYSTSFYHREIKLSNASKLFSNPYQLFVDIYGWGGASFQSALFLQSVWKLLSNVGINAFLTEDRLGNSSILYLSESLYIEPSSIPAQALSIGIDTPIANGDYPLFFPIDDWVLTLYTNANQPLEGKAYIGWDGSITPYTTSFPSVAEFGIRLALPKTTNPHVAFQTVSGFEIAFDSLEINTGVEAESSNGVATLGRLIFSIDFKKLKFSLNFADSDSFISSIISKFGDDVSLEVDLLIRWTRQNGFYFEGKSGLSLNQSFNKLQGGVSIKDLTLSLVPKANSLSLLGVISSSAMVGPLVVEIDGLGLNTTIDFESDEFGLFGFNLGIEPPKGIGIGIQSENISGGGYLYFDATNHTYAGVASLSFQNKLKLNAVGLLQTELPGGQSGYSFVLLITAQFSPIQLGFGFTLNAVGGLIGINRSFSTSYLRNLVQSGGMDSLLFPANVLANPQLAIATVDNAFPATEGRYVFGLMARIGWGTPNLITLDAALIIELPSPVRLALLGVLRAVLPDLNNPIIRLRADFLGTVDFGAKKVSFDAMLVDSRILQFALTGNMAFRLYQGDNPVFVLTAGGFHPAFQPPANADLPTLRRITLALAQGGDFRLTLSSYLAITSNTVQFGSRLDLYVGLPASYYIEGYLAFDALFQFNPFHVQVQIGAGVAIKRNGSSKLSISLSLLVSGPGPWHVKGEGSFKILFIRIRFGIDRSFGSNANQPALPTTDVRALLKVALGETASWEVLPPATRASSTTVLRKEEQPSAGQPSRLLIDPGGALVIKQKIVPLDFPVDVYGNTRTTNGNRFNITSATIGGSTNLLQISGASLGEIREAFAPGQFKRMSDAEKLSAPSFQLMRNGVRLNAIDGLVGSVGIVKNSDFEMRVIEPATGANLTGNRPSSNSNTNLVAGGGTTGPVITPSSGVATLPGALFQRLARNGANGRTRRSYQQRRPSRKAPDQVLWDEDAYAVVSTRDLQPRAGAPNPFATEAEASAYVTAQLAQNPSLAGELQVVPVYQLDVTAPDTTSSYATA